jgi:hypothetical protein
MGLLHDAGVAAPAAAGSDGVQEGPMLLLQLEGGAHSDRILVLECQLGKFHLRNSQCQRNDDSLPEQVQGRE